MKISPVNIYQYQNKTVSPYSPKTNPIVCNREIGLSNVYYLPFKGKVDKDTLLYGNTHKFAKDFSDRIDKRLKMPTVEDIKRTVATVQQTTGCDETTARNIIAKLSQFTSTKSLSAINTQFEKDNIYAVCGGDMPVFALNSFMNYVAEKDQIFVKGCEKEAVFLDDTLIDYYAKLKETNPEKYEKELADIKNESKIYVLHNYNALIDGKKTEYSMFAQSDSLDNLAINVIKHQQETGESLDDISDKRIIEKAKTVFGDDLDVNIIKNIPSAIDDEGLLNLQQPPRLSQKEIECLINLIANEVEKSGDYTEYGNPGEIAKVVVSKYYDTMLRCYSPQSINAALKDMHSKILETVKELGKTEEDIIYLVPDASIPKSFDLLAYQYMVANNLPAEKFIKQRTNSGMVDNPVFNNKVAVVIDDFAGSGESMLLSKFNYSNFVNSFPDSNVIFAPLVASNYAQSAIKKEISKNLRFEKDRLIFNELSEYNKFRNFKLKKPEQKEIFDFIKGHEGYDKNNTCCVFPLTEPDNNNNLGHILAASFLSNPYSAVTPAARITWDFCSPLNDIYESLSYNDTELLGHLFRYSDF